MRRRKKAQISRLFLSLSRRAFEPETENPSRQLSGSVAILAAKYHIDGSWRVLADLCIYLKLQPMQPTPPKKIFLFFFGSRQQLQLAMN